MKTRNQVQSKKQTKNTKLFIGRKLNLYTLIDKILLFLSNCLFVFDPFLWFYYIWDVLLGAQSPSGGFAGLNEEMLASWRKNIEQSLLAGAGSGVFPWTVGGQDSRVGLRTPGSPNTTRSETPHTDRQTPIDSRYPIDGSKTPSDEGRLSPAARSEGSQSPGKCEGVSPTPSPLPTPFSGQGLVPRSFANTVNTNTSSSSPSQLSIPPLFTSRIPKGDPLEERLHDMLR